MQNEEPAKTDEPVKPTAAPKVDETLDKVVDKINDADSILVTLSNDPTVDEMTAALGLTLMLDKYGKHVTAIYSGKTPNALEFLRPDETFEADTNSLQDFIIALNKEKADHLRYKIEGDFVKVYITPYKTTISESDLEFSRGEVNVDLVIAIDVIETEDLDAALSQHGRIMHNAGLINISNVTPGRLGGVEWNNVEASSVSEMIVILLEQLGQPITKEVATALLTGIIAATERFSNERTTPDTMALASRLMQLGADQQLIVAQMASAKEDEPEEKQPEEGQEWVGAEEMINQPVDSSDEESPEAINIKHEEELTPEQQLERMINGDNAEKEVNTKSIMDELKEAALEPAKEDVVEPIKEAMPEPSVAMPTVEPKQEVSEPIMTAPATEAPKEEFKEEPKEEPKEELPTLTVPGISEFAPPVTPVEPDKEDPGIVAAVPQSKVETNSIYGTAGDRSLMQDKTLTPLEERPKDYGAMMDEVLAEEPVNPAITAAPVVAETPVMPATPVTPVAPVTQEPVAPVTPEPAMPVMQEPVAPVVPAMPEAQPMMGGVELPPPPVPDVSGTAMPPTAPAMPAMPPVVPIELEQPMQPVQPMQSVQDESAAQLTVEAPTGVQVQAEPVNPVVVQPDQNPASVPPVQDPGAFKIPGM